MAFHLSRISTHGMATVSIPLAEWFATHSSHIHHMATVIVSYSPCESISNSMLTYAFGFPAQFFPLLFLVLLLLYRAVVVCFALYLRCVPHSTLFSSQFTIHFEHLKYSRKSSTLFSPQRWQWISSDKSLSNGWIIYCWFFSLSFCFPIECVPSRISTRPLEICKASEIGFIHAKLCSSNGFLIVRPTAFCLLIRESIIQFSNRKNIFVVNFTLFCSCCCCFAGFFCRNSNRTNILRAFLCVCIPFEWVSEAVYCAAYSED